MVVVNAIHDTLGLCFPIPELIFWKKMQGYTIQLRVLSSAMITEKLLLASVSLIEESLVRLRVELLHESHRSNALNDRGFDVVA